MPIAESHTSQVRARWTLPWSERIAAVAPALIDFGVPFLLVAYLAFREGGYGEIVRGQVGLVVWLVVLLGTLARILPLRPLARSGWVGTALIAGLLIWTGLAMLWSESAERTAFEVERTATLLGIFVLGLCLQREGALRRTVAGIGAAIALIAVLALGSRFLPGAFPANDLADGLPTELPRLAYPLDYWNGLATLIALGLPLLLWLSIAARPLAARALACAALPALALVGYYTFSRGGLVEALIGLGVMAVLMRRRLLLAGPLILGAMGSVALVFLAAQRSELSDNLMTGVADYQGRQMLVFTVVVCAAAGTLNYLLQSAIDRGMVGVPSMPPRIGRRLLAIGGAVLLIAAVALNAPGRVGDRWEEFKQPITPTGDASRFQTLNGSGRYQWWDSAISAAESEPLLGIGPGTFEYWFARDDVEITGFVRDAHSLYLETWAELGPVGAILILGIVGGAIALGTSRTLNARAAPGVLASTLPAAATGSLAAFAAGAAIDWSWEMTVLPVCFLLIAAGAIGFDHRATVRLRWALPIAAVVSLVLIAPPVISSMYLQSSKESTGEGQLIEALNAARRSADLLPFAASPLIQEAQILQLGGDVDAAVEPATAATEKEPTNWRSWYVLSGILAELGDTEAADAAYEEAKELNPRSAVTAQPPAGYEQSPP